MVVATSTVTLAGGAPTGCLSLAVAAERIAAVEVTSIGSFSNSIFVDDLTYTPSSPNVQLLGFEEIDSPLDNNPNIGAGQRIFPDKEIPGDTVDKKKVRAKATVGSPNVTVFFKSFDVDDPSSDAAHIDGNGLAGNDNRGMSQSGTLNAVSAQTDSNGVAQVEFTVTKQPGDNFRVAASTDEVYLSEIVNSGGTILEDSSGNVLPTAEAKVTPLLTVWRRLHIEMDSMGFVGGNFVTGTILKAKPRFFQTNLTIDQVFGNEEKNRFENGRILIDGVGAFSVISNTSGGNPKVTVEGIVQDTAAAGKTFVLVDDDDFNNDDGAPNLDGDANEDVTAPDTSLIQESDNPTQNVFAPAYVKPFYIGGNDDFVGFILNTPAPGMSNELRGTYDFNAQGTEADPDLWTVYLLGAYQYLLSDDNDPSREGGILGVADTTSLSTTCIASTPVSDGEGASVFMEVIRIGGGEATPLPSDPRSGIVNNAATTAHEVGHALCGLHDDGGLMAQSRERTSTQLMPSTIARIRALLHP